MGISTEKEIICGPPASTEWFGQNYESGLIGLRYNFTEIVNYTNKKIFSNQFKPIQTTTVEILTER